MEDESAPLISFKEKKEKILSTLGKLGINLESQRQALSIYDQLKGNNPPLYPREELQNYTKQLDAGTNILLSNFHRILSNMVGNKTKASVLLVQNLSKLGGQLQMPIPQDIASTVIPCSIVDFTPINIRKKLAIIHNLPENLRNDFTNTKQDDVAFILIDFKRDAIKVDQKEARKTIDEFIHQLSMFDKETPVLVLNVLPSVSLTEKMVKEIIAWSGKKPMTQKEEDLHAIKIVKLGGKPDEGQIQEQLAFTTNVKPDNSGKIIFKFKTSGKQCSPYRLHISLDGKEKYVTEWFGWKNNAGPMETDLIIFNDVDNGEHELKLQPEGAEEGCNKGYIGSWEGTLLLTQEE